eukprot:1678271-Pyramimonas_sp.AAC.1
MAQGLEGQANLPLEDQHLGPMPRTVPSSQPRASMDTLGAVTFTDTLRVDASWDNVAVAFGA